MHQSMAWGRGRTAGQRSGGEAAVEDRPAKSACSTFQVFDVQYRPLPGRACREEGTGPGGGAVLVAVGGHRHFYLQPLNVSSMWYHGLDEREITYDDYIDNKIYYR